MIVPRHRNSDLLPPPSDPLRVVFTHQALKSLRAKRNASPGLTDRLAVLTASGPSPSDPGEAYRLKRLRARKAAWETYLLAAFACGLFEGQRGNDLRSRLTGGNDGHFRSAMAECMACWFLVGQLGFEIESHAPGRPGKQLDLLVKPPDSDHSIHVEVKAPFHERSASGTFPVHYGYGPVLRKAMERANRQFSPDTANVLLLAPDFRKRVKNFGAVPDALFANRYPLIWAFFGHHEHAFGVDTRTGQATEGRTEFRGDGKFWRPFRKDGSPAFTRISGVFVLEQGRLVDRPRNESFITHQALFLHNDPGAKHALPTDIWAPCVQFRRYGEFMQWDDGADLFGRHRQT